uniref:Putative major royal jelly protein n=1 Tax=Lutzomyia longipalpis TaxID=7200 RepID=A0A1B0CBH0_LUTLO
MKVFFSIFTLVLFQGTLGADTQGYKWKQLLYNNVTPGSYNPDNMISTAFAYDAEGEKLFLAVPRKLPRVPYTLAEVDTKNSLGLLMIVVAFGWLILGRWNTPVVMLINIPKEKPTLIAYDLKKDHTPEIHRFEIPDNLYSSQVEFGGFAVDVVNTKGDCTESFVYLTNFKDNSLIVYDETQRKAWKFTDKTFEADKESTFSYSGEEQMKYKVGLFGIALGDRDEMGHRPAYYIAGSSTKVYSVNTKELKTENGQLNPQLHGDRGGYTDAIALAYDPAHKVLYFAESDSRQVSCWNVNMELKPDNTDVIFSSARFAFGTDILVDSKGMLWIMANGHPPVEDQEKIWKMRFVNRKIRIMKVETERVFKYSRCNPNYKPPKEIEV